MLTLSLLLSQAPGLLLTAAGIAIAVIRWARHPTVSMMVVLGLVLRLFSSMGSLVLARGMAGSSMSSVAYGGLGLVGLVGVGLLVGAAFTERP